MISQLPTTVLDEEMFFVLRARLGARIQVVGEDPLDVEFSPGTMCQVTPSTRWSFVNSMWVPHVITVRCVQRRFLIEPLCLFGGGIYFNRQFLGPFDVPKNDCQICFCDSKAWMFVRRGGVGDDRWITVQLVGELFKVNVKERKVASLQQHPLFLDDAALLQIHGDEYSILEPIAIPPPTEE